ncbi:hypothetical protein N2601_17845 [Rhizobium sp. CB3060]|uniref:hypothetical protein n=1 Tax=Rhizobium sp. CB3060 TaxID=3138255 RepID=UPI0021A3DAEE|nr:hypothetical protein [Rhizobium tropici]UWU21087.1 hypothetical protein N2601_17845 [Rhizobium tropici]
MTQNPDGSFSAPNVAPDDPHASQENATGMAGMVAPVTGGLKSVFETKDFLFGDTPPERQSAARQFVESLDQHIKQESPIIGGLSSGIGQFTVAMMGLGKLGSLAKAVPLVGESLASGQAFAEAYKYGKAGLEAGKAALAGAIAFDPHEARLSNLIQDTPLANSFNAWLAAKPGDSAAMGRLKNAMESLGMDAAIIGTFTGGLKIWKYLKAGDTASASRAVSSLEAEQHSHIAREQQANTGAGQQPGTVDPQKYNPANQNAVASPSVTEGAGSEAASAQSNPAGAAIQELAGGSEAQPQVPTQQEATPGEARQMAAQAQDLSDTGSTPTVTTEPPTAANPPPFKPVVEFQPSAMPSLLDELPSSLENAQRDWEAMVKYGSWGKMAQAGQRLSPDLGTLWDRFKNDSDVLEAMDLAVNHKAEELQAQGFRGTLTDPKLQEQIAAFASLTGTDPAGLAGILQQAGEASTTLTAKMITAGSLAAKAFQDASLLAMRRKIGDYTQHGSVEAMEQEIAKRFSIATTFLKIASDIRSQAGRSLRANRGKPFDPSLFEGVSKDRLFDLLVQAQANPNALKTLADPRLGRKIMDTVNYMRVSSLVSGPKTQLINMMTNGYMLGVRPMERILGSIPGAVAGSDASKALIKENLKQYSYMGSAFYDGFSQAVKAFANNDGVLRPHNSEAFGPEARWQVPGTQALGANYFKPWDSIPNVLYNAFSIPLSVAGVAPRTLGGVDELVKQIVYRSKLAASANMEGTEQAVKAGLTGKSAKDFVKSYVSQRLDNAFDAEGRGLDPNALREANIATFQQDLLPGTFGKNVQNFISNDKTQLVRLILPFVKTPTNVIRYGWKMTPGLNMFQEEYRQMLSGALGQEAKAQAVGQMTMGSLFMGAAAFLGAQGMVTGGGSSNPQFKAQALATGWQPYSIVVQHDDGTKSYIPFNRYDPIALPFGIIADIQDAYHIMGDDADGTPEIENAKGALLISLAKQFTSRTYLLSLNQALDAITDPDANGVRFAGSMAQSMVPFSGATRQLSTDPYLRDARTIADKMMQVIPGMSQDLPPKYNWLGQPVLNRQGLWSDDNGSLVDQETLRLGLEGGGQMNPPSPSWNGVDLRNITMTNGDNAYVAYQRLAGKPSPNAKSLRDTVADAMRSEAYKRAPDGDRDVRGTKMWLLATRINKYRDAAGARIRADKNVRDALMAAQRKVVDHYAHLKQEAQSGQKQGSVQGIIDGFGAGQ